MNMWYCQIFKSSFFKLSSGVWKCNLILLILLCSFFLIENYGNIWFYSSQIYYFCQLFHWSICTNMPFSIIHFFLVENACKRCCRSNINETCSPVDSADILADGTPCIQGFCNNVCTYYFNHIFIKYILLLHYKYENSEHVFLIEKYLCVKNSPTLFCHALFRLCFYTFNE